MDDLMDMKNGHMAVSGSYPEHLVLVPNGQWIGYYIPDHTSQGRSHCLAIKPDVRGKLPSKPQIEQLLKEFRIEIPLIDAHIHTDKGNLHDIPQLNQLMNEIGIENPLHDNNVPTDKGFSQTNIIIPIIT